MSLAPHIRILGRGPSRARALTRPEARDAMEIILRGEAAPEAVGALLMLMRYRGESAPEIAGFTDALHRDLGDWQSVPTTIDWPSYAAGRTRGAPLFLLSAKLVAAAGYPVLLHGWNAHQNPVASVRAALPDLGIAEAATPKSACDALERDGIAYVPAEALHAPALALLQLRDVLGLRSCLNTVLRMTNPTAAPIMLQGVFHPSYRDLQTDAAALLGQSEMAVIKGGGGEFERHPAKPVTLMGLKQGKHYETCLPPVLEASRRLHDPDLPQLPLTALWSGVAEDDFASHCVIATAALALMSCGLAADDAHDQARTLWSNRARKLAA